ncbi:epoxide hydrolase domain-containing protein [Crassisporium funariophilum]|nr:epoxide hydrolase domain-containing protein [Crassisporium funariophilum]
MSDSLDTVPQPFTIDVSSETLDWITQRVNSARIVADVAHPQGKEWTDGVPSSTMNALVDHWKSDYDWRAVETRLNSTFRMFTLPIAEGSETINLHFVHHRSERPGAIPLIFAHGWPGNFTEVESLLSLTAPDDPKQQAFHIVAPTLPGFVFSSAPQSSGFGITQIASVYHQLMLKLGYTRYVGQGGDWGSLVLRAMALAHPGSCIGILLNFVIALPPTPTKNPVTLMWLALRWFTPDEKKKLSRMQWWSKNESGYSKIQGTKPQTISFGLADSPIGMMAWIREKLEILVEPDYVWDKDMVITWTMLYLLSGSAFSARIYKDAVTNIKEEVLQKKISSAVAFGASCFPLDIAYVPKWWAKATVADNIVFWKEHAKGGHFPSIECGELLKGDILAFIDTFSEEKRQLLNPKYEAPQPAIV